MEQAQLRERMASIEQVTHELLADLARLLDA
jgi:hypothetical protein